MSFIQRAIERVSDALRGVPRPNRYSELYGTQQALAWALDPNAADSPLAMLQGTPLSAADYLAYRDPRWSSNTCFPAG